MTGNLNAGSSVESGDNEWSLWIMELLLPGIFTVIMLACLTYLGFSTLQAEDFRNTQTNYAISAFAS